MQSPRFQQLAPSSSVILLRASSHLISHLRIRLRFIVFESNRGNRRYLTCKTTKNSYKMCLVKKPRPNVSIELFKSISTQKAHKICLKQCSKLYYFGTNHLTLQGVLFYSFHPYFIISLQPSNSPVFTKTLKSKQKFTIFEPHFKPFVRKKTHPCVQP